MKILTCCKINVYTLKHMFAAELFLFFLRSLVSVFLLQVSFTQFLSGHFAKVPNMMCCLWWKRDVVHKLLARYRLWVYKFENCFVGSPDQQINCPPTTKVQLQAQANEQPLPVYFPPPAQVASQPS